jgi:hypothetical protein
MPVRGPNAQTRHSLHSVVSPTVTKRRSKPALPRHPKPTSPLEVCQHNESTSVPDRQQIYPGSGSLSISGAGRLPSLRMSPPTTSTHDDDTCTEHTPHISSDWTSASPQVARTIRQEYVRWNKEQVRKRFEGIAPGLGRYVKPADILLGLFPVRRNKSGQDLVSEQQTFIELLLQEYVPSTLC